MYLKASVKSSMDWYVIILRNKIHERNFYWYKCFEVKKWRKLQIGS